MTNYKPTLQECAMRYGTGMGLLWAFKFMLFPLGLRIPFLQLLFIVLTIGVPFLGYIICQKVQRTALWRKHHFFTCVSIHYLYVYVRLSICSGSALHLLPLYRWRVRIRGIPLHLKSVQRNCRTRTDNLTKPI